MISGWGHFVSPHPSLVEMMHIHTPLSRGDDAYTHPPLIERTRYSYAPIEIICIDTLSWEMNPLGPLGFRFDPEELMSLRNHREGVHTDRVV
jgi:hypothetical protein